MAAKNQLCRKSYQLPDGTSQRSADPSAKSITFAFANGVNEVLSPSDFDEDMRHCFTLFGMSEKLGNAYAGATSADEAAEWFLALLETIKAGDWTEERGEGGPRVGDVATAIMCLADKEGKPYDKAAVIAKYAGKEGKAARDKAKTYAAVAAELSAIAQERVAAQAAKRAAKSTVQGGVADLI